MAEKLVLPKDTFYILEAGVGKAGERQISLHVEMKTAIDMVHEYIASMNVPAERITLTRVVMEPKQMSAQGIPWSTIAVELIKGVKKS